MAKQLPYQARTSMGDVLDVRFRLHDQTQSAMRVSQMITLVLDALDRDIGVVGETSNGDVLQALAMALAIRSEMISAPSEVTGRLTLDLVRRALEDTAASEKTAPTSGRA